MAPATGPAERLAVQAGKGDSAPAKTVLVADDTAFVRDRFRAALEAAGHRTITVRTAPELFTQLRSAGPAALDLIVLDLRLSQGNGVALMQDIRKIDAERPPVVVFSGTIGSAHEVRQLGALGVKGYVNEYAAAQHIVPALTPHLSQTQNNQRSSPRVSLAIPVSYRVGNSIATALTVNISQGGVALRTTNPLQPDAAVRLRFRLPGKPAEIDATARVVWSDRRFGMGLQFTNLDPRAAAVLEEFVQAHFFNNRKA